ncbi:MAG: hypothetical protein WC082_02470 [Victivallales bacterium]
MIKVSPDVATAVPSRAFRNYAPWDRGGYTFSDFINISFVTLNTQHVTRSSGSGYAGLG